MLEEIKSWLPVVALAVTSLWGYFKLHARQEKSEEFEKRQLHFNEEVQEDLDELKENRTKNNTMLENLIKMQEENRLDVKLILQQIATLAANQGKGREKDE